MADGDALPALLVVGLLLILGTLPGSTLAQESLPGQGPDGNEAPGPPELHLRGDEPEGGSYRNFTTGAPDGTRPLSVAPCSVATEGIAHWCWQMHRSPKPWTLKTGAKAEAVVHLDALDRVPVGLIDADDPDQSGKLRIDVILTRGTSDEVAHGTTWVDPPALGADEHTSVRVPLHVPADAHWNTEPGDSPAVELQIKLSGLVRRDEPPMILTGSETSDSRIVLPGFPLEAFREWEHGENEADTCLKEILAQRSCEGEPEVENSTSLQTERTEEAPADPLGVVVVVALIGLCARGHLSARKRLT